MSATVHFAGIDELIDELADAEVKASADPGLVRTPGGWIRHMGFSFDRLGGFTHKLNLHLVVADNGYLRARDELAALLVKVLTVLDPDDDPFYQGLQLPGGKPLPGLVVPFNLADEYQE